MDFGITPEQLRSGLILYILLVVCLTLRAYGQAWMAHRLGDDTPQAAGRLTLNPLPHIDTIGSIVLPLICIFYLQPRTGVSFFLAWTKPVPINPSAFAHPRSGFLKTQLAGPLMSMVAAVLCAVAMGFTYHRYQPLAFTFKSLMDLNACLIVIDFLPVPPLPGGMLLRHIGLISEEMFWSISRWSGLALIVAFNIPAFQYFFMRLIYYLEIPLLVLFNLLNR